MLLEDVRAPNHVCGMERRENVCDVVFGCHRSSHFTFSVKKEHREVRNCSFAKAKKSKGRDGCDHHVDADIFLCECCQLHEGSDKYCGFVRIAFRSNVFVKTRRVLCCILLHNCDHN